MIHKEIPFNGDLHPLILAGLQERIRLSESRMASRWEKMREADELAVGYLKASDADSLRKGRKKSEGRHDYVAVEIPYSYGMMLSAHTYHSSVFLGRSPVLQFEGRHGEAEDKVLGVEALMGYQYSVGKMALPYYIWLYDTLKYGMGIVFNHWEEDWKVYTEITRVPEVINDVDTGRMLKEKKTRKILGYKGNKLINVRPYDYLPDPRVPVMYPQQGEYVGRKFDISWNEIAVGLEEGIYFNEEAARKNIHMNAAREERGSTQVEWPQDHQTLGTMKELGFGRGVELIIRLIPKDWQLGDSKYPEKWIFTVLNEEVIIGCRPLGEMHDQFPSSVLEPEVEGYQLFKAGLPEQMQPMNDVLSWLFNAHFWNVRAALNNQFVYDPQRVYEEDMYSDDPGLAIRLKPEAWGTDVRTAVHQLQVGDATRTHLQDFAGVGELMQRIYGITDPLMGVPSQKNRQSATEVRQNAGFGANRLKVEAEYMSALGWDPLAQMMLQSTQQHYSGEERYRILGAHTQPDPFVNVTPETIAGSYDFTPVDGTLPVDRFAMANLWKEVLMGMRQMPQVAATYDQGGIFSWMAKLAGMRNIDSFRIDMQDPGTLEEQERKGDLVAINAGAEAGIQPGVTQAGGPDVVAALAGGQNGNPTGAR